MIMASLKFYTNVFDQTSDIAVVERIGDGYYWWFIEKPEEKFGPYISKGAAIIHARVKCSKF